MAAQSLAEAVLVAIEKIYENCTALNSDDRKVREPAARQLYRVLGGLEYVAEKRVDKTTYENHRRYVAAWATGVAGLPAQPEDADA